MRSFHLSAAAMVGRRRSDFDVVGDRSHAANAVCSPFGCPAFCERVYPPAEHHDTFVDAHRDVARLHPWLPAQFRPHRCGNDRRRPLTCRLGQRRHSHSKLVGNELHPVDAARDRAGHQTLRVAVDPPGQGHRTVTDGDVDLAGSYPGIAPQLSHHLAMNRLVHFAASLRKV
jgi:hypothetical protein